jgi:hypothetical protein
MVNDDSAIGQALQCAVFADQDFAYVVIVANAAKHNIRIPRRFEWRQRDTALVFVTPCFGFCSRSVVDDYIVATFRKVAGHGVAHDA